LCKWLRRYSYIVWLVRFNDKQRRYAHWIALGIMFNVQWLRIQAIVNKFMP